MAGVLVSALLEQLASIAAGEAEQKIKLVVGVDEEVRKLKDNLLMIQPVLEDAEKRQMTEAAVKLWLGKLKYTFELMDDVLDEWNTELIKARIQEEEKEEENAESSHARKKMKVSLSMIPSPSSCLRPVHKLRMRDGFAHEIKDLSGKLDELFKERVGFGFELNRNTKVVERPTTTSLVDVSKICGRGKEREELVSNLLGKDSQEEKSPHVISLVGMGGMGKTTILDNNLWELEDVQNVVSRPLLFSYNELPSAIKQCFLYCANFPKDYLFSRNELVYQWMAQGYCGSKSNMEDIGERNFEELVMHSFFQDFEKDDNDDDKIIRYKMHDMVHDFASSMTTNECFTIDVDKVLRIDWKSARHLTLELKEETQFPVSIYSAKNLRTLFLRTPYFGRVVFSSDLFQHLTCLRSLNLKDSSFEKLPDEVEKLKHLRLLNLSGSNITEIPEMMCNLCNLQTLDISGCGQIKKLPQGMGKLIKLRHLLIDDCEELTEPFPKGIGRLSSLRTLNRFVIGGLNNFGECKLGDLKNLVHLKGYLGIEGLQNVTDVQEAENAQLKMKTHLRELSLSGGNDELVLNALEPHPELESLWIYDYGGTGYPNWVMSLTILKKLVLGDCNKLEQLPPLGKLCFLESLEIWCSDSMKKVGVEFLGIESNRKKDEEKGSTSTSSPVLFPSLKYLDLRFMEEWEEWDGKGESGVSESVLIMPCLQVLTIQQCPKLKSLPNFLEKTLLEVLTIDCRISNWMTLACHLPRLKSLRCDNLNSGEHFPTLGKLLFLESLMICDAESVKKVGFEFLGIEEESNNNINNKKIDEEKGSTSSSSSSLVLFPKLKSLKFWRLKEWEEWDGIGGTMREEEAQESGVTITIMPCLQDLSINNCPKLKSLPDLLPTTPLKTLRIQGSLILSECCKAEIGDQWPKISHIPNVEID